METHAMSLIRSGYAAAKRWGLPAVLFSALLALSLFHPFDQLPPLFQEEGPAD
jgi:hypothetical protein